MGFCGAMMPKLFQISFPQFHSLRFNKKILCVEITFRNKGLFPGGTPYVGGGCGVAGARLIPPPAAGPSRPGSALGSGSKGLGNGEGAAAPVRRKRPCGEGRCRRR